MPKIHNEEYLKRIEMVQNSLAMGVSNYNIKRYIQEKWGVSFRTAKRYLKAAQKLQEELGNGSNNLLKGKCLARLEHLYSQANANQNTELAAQIVEKMARLGNSTGGNANGTSTTTVPISPQLERALRRIAERKGTGE